MVKSRGKYAGHARYFWQPPWKSKTTGLLRPVLEATPWLCLDCGAVIAYIEDEKLQILREEFEEEKLKGAQT
ncbi:hypothetical protein P8X24_01665 [Pyrococcus kukulkanii]|uniref:hypothetical protein n=1 Tax=Pyrococcus kukulkanii TaxID=1609559 RepID=UPI003564961B